MKLLRVLAAIALVAVSAIGLPAQEVPPLRVHFFDVGQGDGVLIQSPTGQNVVYDAGTSATAMLDYLTGFGIGEVSLVIASHNHSDHIGGLPSIIRTFHPSYYMDNGVPATTLAYTNMLEAVAAAGSQILEPVPRRISLGDVSLNVIGPPGIASWDQNDNSIAVVVEYGSFRLSLAGDAEPREWSWWNVNNREWMSAVDVHKASHHGSSNGDTAETLARLAPKSVVVGVGESNGYGHPDASALRLYENARATVYRTDRNGTVIIEAQPSGSYSVRVERGEGAQPPPAPSPTPSPSPAPTPSAYTLSGSIQDGTSSAALADVAVRITDGTNLSRSTTTNSSGAYSLSGLSTGSFTVAFSKSGYNTATRSVTLSANTSLNLSLTRTATSPAPQTRYRIGAVCRDGWLSDATGSGACSSHGGVACWRYSDGSCTNP